MRSSNATFYTNLLGHRTAILKTSEETSLYVIVREREGTNIRTYLLLRINEVAGFVSAKDTDVLSQADQDRTEDVRILP